MKGDLAVCANPKCSKQFVKKKINQKCCGNASCRTLYNRHKKGEPLYPDFLKYNSEKKARPSGFISNNDVDVGKSLFGKVVSSGAGAAMNHAAKSIGGGGLFGNVATTVVSSALIPYLKNVISSGMRFSFSSLDTELDVWKARLAYWESRRNEVNRGVVPMKFLAVGTGAALAGYSFSPNEDKKVNTAFWLGALGAAVGAYFDFKNMQEFEINKQFMLEEAERGIVECNKQIDIYTNDRSAYQQLVDEDILVENSDGVYEVSPDILSGGIGSGDYQKVDIDFIKFKGAYHYLLGSPGKDFYKIVTGAPGNGKSTYAVKFADYFARNHGNVVYFPAEQSGLNKDFQNLLRRVKVTADNLIIHHKTNALSVKDVIAIIKHHSGKLVVLDSVNKMKLTPDDIITIRKECSGVGLLAVMQSTKDGKFKGSQEYKHDCDIYLEAQNFVIYQSKARSAGAANMAIDKIVV